MSLTNKQIEELRTYAKDRKGELAKLINDAADTIEMLSAKLHASQMERSSQYYHGGWISVSERLPEVGTYVLVSKKALGFKSNLPNVCTAHRSCDPRSGKEEWNGMLFGKLDDDDVLAWMPLPSAYREEGES